MSLETRLTALATRVATEFKTIRTEYIGKMLGIDNFNHIADGMLTDPTFSYWGASLTRVAAVGTTPAYIEWVTGSSGNAHRYNNHIFDTLPGDRFFYDVEVSTPASNTVGVTTTIAIQTQDASGTTVTWPQVGLGSIAPNTAWTRYTGTITIPAGNSIRGQFDPFTSAGTTAGQVIRMRKMTLTRIEPGVAVVDTATPTTDFGEGSLWYDTDEPGVTTQTDAAALTTGTLAIARLPSSVLHRVVYSGGAWPARPSGATYVEWVGPVAPAGMTGNDTFTDTSA